METFWKPAARELLRRLEGSPRLIQILVGPRQVGKTTALDQIAQALLPQGFSTIMASADAVAAPPAQWISEHWQRANALARGGKPALLFFDELQKIPGWSEIPFSLAQYCRCSELGFSISLLMWVRSEPPGIWA
ncbi:MAG: AAA family ATPase [Elusimicrobia bacterium]|nr:AAA family ATPase [Elusimicrobiota bacterium]